MKYSFPDNEIDTLMFFIEEGIKELKYITFGLFGYGNAKSEYEWLKTQKLR